MLANEMKHNDEPIIFKKRLLKIKIKKELPLHKAKFSQQNSSDIPLTVMDVVMMGRYPYFNSIPHQSDIDAVLKSMAETDVVAFKDRDYNTLSSMKDSAFTWPEF